LEVAIIVLGNPPEKEGVLPYNLRTRLDKALQEYKKYPGSTLILTGGSTYNKYIEAVEMKKYCSTKGVCESDILLETEARSTYDNAFFVAEMLKDIKVGKIIIVTSRYHRARSRLIFRNYFKKFEVSVPKLTPLYIIRNMYIYLWEMYLVIKLKIIGDKRMDRVVENNVNNI
jgi:uncharacterized SAM-binding protein YcdF (DUF218 family)